MITTGETIVIQIINVLIQGGWIGVVYEMMSVYNPQDNVLLILCNCFATVTGVLSVIYNEIIKSNIRRGKENYGNVTENNNSNLKQVNLIDVAEQNNGNRTYSAVKCMLFIIIVTLVSYIGDAMTILLAINRHTIPSINNIAFNNVPSDVTDTNYMDYLTG